MSGQLEGAIAATSGPKRHQAAAATARITMSLNAPPTARVAKTPGSRRVGSGWRPPKRIAKPATNTAHSITSAPRPSACCGRGPAMVVSAKAIA
ncbi:hypothetical protein D3C72_1063610 [compost metagenome]